MIVGDEGQVPSTVKGVRAARLRRGLLAGAAALMGAGLARLATTERAEATHNAGTATGPVNNDAGALHVDLVNSGTQRTFLSATVAGNPPMVFFNGSGPFSIGQADAVQGITRSNVNFAAGIQGRNQAASGQSIGVFGTTSSTSGTGVFGTSGLLPPPIPAEATGVGVFGNGDVSGVRGRSGAGIGVFGASTSATGVFGTATSGFGVQGLSADAFGVSGNSTTQAGVWGSSNTNVACSAPRILVSASAASRPAATASTRCRRVASASSPAASAGQLGASRATYWSSAT
jgi:hypothetical protein